VLKGSVAGNRDAARAVIVGSGAKIRITRKPLIRHSFFFGRERVPAEREGRAKRQHQDWTTQKHQLNSTKPGGCIKAAEENSFHLDEKSANVDVTKDAAFEEIGPVPVGAAST
jgi:hypothetical protein